tara:strand:+ start:158 stop:679 length:522 start_codon:yes stop_codon:yes gene_type:complete
MTYNIWAQAQDVGDDEWPSGVIFDTIHVCYNGTLRWVAMGNPNLLSQPPPYPIGRAMTIHCFCVLDKIRTRFKYKAYVDFIKNDDIKNPTIIPKMFMETAIECIRDFGTLGGLVVLDEEAIKGLKDLKGFVDPKDNETTEKKQIEEPDNGSGESDSIPEQPNEPIGEVPQINF